MLDDFEYGTTKYQLNLIFLLDTSASMAGEAIKTLNDAMADAILMAENVAKEEEIQLLMRVVEFNSIAKWIYGDEQRGVEHIDWSPLLAGGGTDTAGAIELACSVMHRKYLGERGLHPVVILITDGESNEPDDTAKAILRLKTSLNSKMDPCKDKIIRIAIGVRGADQEELSNFASIGNIEHEDGTLDESVPLVFNVDNLAFLKQIIKSVTVSSIGTSKIYTVNGDIVICLSGKEYYGKEKCKILREIRKKIALANEIPYNPETCNHVGVCVGSCSVCDNELQYIDEMIKKRIFNNEKIYLDGLAEEEIKLFYDTPRIEEYEDIMGIIPIEDEDDDGEWEE